MATTATTNYIPQFKTAHATLFEAYQNALLATDESGIRFWCEYVKGIMIGWQALKEQGVLSPNFCQGFVHDISDIARTIHATVDVPKLAEPQKLLTLALANLRDCFGAR